jgi:hypothetical protein
MITQEQFEAYEDIRQSGVTNMFNFRVVSQLTDLNKEQITEIMHNYSELKKKYYPKH